MAPRRATVPEESMPPPSRPSSPPVMDDIEEVGYQSPNFVAEPDTSSLDSLLRQRRRAPTTGVIILSNLTQL